MRHFRLKMSQLMPSLSRSALKPLAGKVSYTSPDFKLTVMEFPQVNQLELLEDVDKLTDFFAQNKVLSIAVIDLIYITTGGLKTALAYDSVCLRIWFC